MLLRTLVNFSPTSFTPHERGKKLLPRPRRRKSPAQLKSTLRFELHFRLCFGKADMAEWLRLELSRGFRDTSRIAFFRTFFSKKKVHNAAAFAGNSLFDDTCTFFPVKAFRHFLTKMPPTFFSAKSARVLRTLANFLRRGRLICSPRLRRTFSLHFSLLSINSKNPPQKAEDFYFLFILYEPKYTQQYRSP